MNKPGPDVPSSFWDMVNGEGTGLENRIPLGEGERDGRGLRGRDPRHSRRCRLNGR